MQTRVILDTSPVRSLAFCAELPAWVGSFARMRSDGYSFSIADGTVGELIAQVSRGATSSRGHERIIAALETFLDAEFPVALGEYDVLISIGALPKTTGYDAEQKALSHASWAALRAAKIEDSAAETELEEDRASWRNVFVKLDEIMTNKVGREDWKENSRNILREHSDTILEDIFSGLNKNTDLFPPMSQRLNLRTKYVWRQYVRTRSGDKGRYDPGAKSKRNDGIDFLLYTYLALPSLVVADDRGFFASIADIDSFQRRWFWRPADLAAEWEQGANPRPTWPETVSPLGGGSFDQRPPGRPS